MHVAGPRPLRRTAGRGKRGKRARARANPRPRQALEAVALGSVLAAALLVPRWKKAAMVGWTGAPAVEAGLKNPFTRL